MQWRYAEEYILYEGKQGILKRPRYTVKYSIKESLGKRIRGCPLPKFGWCWWLWHERSAVPNTPAIMALQAISNIDVVLGAEKKTCHYYDNSKTQKGFFNHFHFSNKFVKRSPELGLYSQTCRIATGLAFQSRLGILKKWNSLIAIISSIRGKQSLKKSRVLYKNESVGVQKWAPSDVWEKYRHTTPLTILSLDDIYIIYMQRQGQ